MTEEQPKKKKRGRPRIHPIVDKPKRRPGRPRKKQTEDVSVYPPAPKRWVWQVEKLLDRFLSEDELAEVAPMAAKKLPPLKAARALLGLEDPPKKKTTRRTNEETTETIPSD